MFRLLLPALIPSWRFFDSIGPSPRIEFALLNTADHADPDWRVFRPHPDHVPFTIMLRRLIWNPRWNESLYLVTCAEQLLEQPSRARANELLSRIAQAVQNGEIAIGADAPQFLRVRVVVLTRERDQILRRVMFTSAALRLAPPRNRLAA